MILITVSDFKLINSVSNADLALTGQALITNPIRIQFDKITPCVKSRNHLGSVWALHESRIFGFDRKTKPKSLAPKCESCACSPPEFLLFRTLLYLHQTPDAILLYPELVARLDHGLSNDRVRRDGSVLPRVHCRCSFAATRDSLESVISIFLISIVFA